MKLEKREENGILYYYCKEMEKEGFKNIFTTKIGGVSFQRNEMNFGTSVGDTEENILKNYEKILNLMGTTPRKTVKSKQTHSNIVLTLDATFGGEGIVKEQRFMEADGLITNEADLTLLVFYADCVPILIADTLSGAVGAVHSGWRGTKSNIISNAVTKMINQFGSKPENLIAAIGPAIGICHFEVQENVFKEFENEPFGITKSENGKFYVDLSGSVKNQLISLQIPESNISVADLCTYCDTSLYSFRREGERAGRMAAFIKSK